MPWRNLAAYGLLIGLVQFGSLYMAINGHIAPGLASLVVQTQVFFTIAFAALMLGERARPVQMAGAGIALAITSRSAMPMSTGHFFGWHPQQQQQHGVAGFV